jgi:hypothetical protein
VLLTCGSPAVYDEAFRLSGTGVAASPVEERNIGNSRLHVKQGNGI